MRFFLKAAAVAWLATSCCLAANPPDLPKRQTREVAGCRIEYSLGDEAYADALAERLPAFQSTLNGRDETAVRAATLMVERRDEFLAKAASALALPKATPAMEKSYDGFRDMIETISFHASPQNFALWRRPELLARLEAGEKIYGFTLGGPTGIEFNFGFHFQKPEGKTREALLEEMAVFWKGAVFPISVRKEENLAAEQEIDRGLENVKDALSFFRGSTAGATMGPFVILHETVEFGIVTHYLQSKDRRWFCDGVANYAAWKILADTFGAEEAKRSYDLDAELAKFADRAARIDLEKWPALENAAKAKYAEDLNTANYAFATKVIADICAKHGDAILPKLFAEIGKTPKEKATIKTVYQAFKKLTGEDMRRYLPKPGKKK